MLRVLGGALVLLASGSFGITAGVRYYRAARHLQAFCRAIELLRCEINYSLQPLPEVCALVADRLAGPPAAFFRHAGPAAAAGCGHGGAGAVQRPRAL